LLGTILSVVGGINSAFDLYRNASTLIKGDSTERVLDALHGINASVERLSNHIVYTDFVGLRDTTQQSQGAVSDLREVRELLEPVQRTLGGDIVSSALLGTPGRMRDTLQANPWAVLHNITPHHLAARPHDPNMVPVMFEHGGVRYIGWQMRGSLPMLFNCELHDLPGLDVALRPEVPILVPEPGLIAPSVPGIRPMRRRSLEGLSKEGLHNEYWQLEKRQEEIASARTALEAEQSNNTSMSAGQRRQITEKLAALRAEQDGAREEQVLVTNLLFRDLDARIIASRKSGGK
jgi:hypothetical protein